MNTESLNKIITLLKSTAAQLRQIIPGQAKPQWRYFRIRDGSQFKVRTDKPGRVKGNTRSDDRGKSWYPTSLHLNDMLDHAGWSTPPVEYFPETENR